jgi:mono/diheme cytochrome c family protein
MKNTNRNWLKLTIYILLTVGFVSAMAMTMNNSKQKSSEENNQLAVQDDNIHVAGNKSDADKKREEESKEAFIAAYRVFMSPRCMNCHPSGDVPLVGDDSRLHPQGVKRGPSGKGLYALKCSNCHQAEHVPGEHMPPGNERWKLPSAKQKMVFQGKTPTQLALHFKDNQYTGFKNFKEDLLHHVEFDPLVVNGWTYGTPPPLSHAEFVAKVKEWIDKGAAIP